MPNIHDPNKDDDVNGQIVGDEYFSGALFYDGRKQGRTIFAKSDSELQSLASDELQAKKNELADVFNQIWPHKLWELRIFT